MSESEKQPSKRVFIAVNAEVEPLRKVMDVQLSMRAVAKSRSLKVTWVPAANLHITLRFLGGVPLDVPEAVRRLLHERLVDRKPFSFGLAGAGAFPSVERPRVIWAGVDDTSGELARLAGDLEGWMRELGFAPEERAFRAHLTLGRVKEGASAADVVTPHVHKSFGVSTVQEVVIYESKPQGQGVEYLALGRVRLGHGDKMVWPASPPWEPGAPRAAAEPEE